MEQRTREWGTTLALVAVVVLALLLTAVIVTTAAIAAAIVAPLAGIAYAAIRLAMARALWTSKGRFQLGGLVRMADQSRTRLLAACEGAAGIAGFAISLAPFFLWMEMGWQAFGALTGGAGLFLVSRVARQWLLNDVRVVEAVPGERERMT